MDTSYHVPTGEGRDEFVEKRSRFIGHLYPVDSESQARSHIDSLKKTYHDARHHCWAYRIKEGGIERYTDDGEPQGTAGQPILNVLQREGIENACCIVVRYFGGIELGTGGLSRAYTQGAKIALTSAGRSLVQCWIEGRVVIPYSLFEPVKLLLEGAGGTLSATDYTDQVTLTLLLPRDSVEGFTQKLTELTAGAVEISLLGEVWRGVPVGDGF